MEAVDGWGVQGFPWTSLPGKKFSCDSKRGCGRMSKLNVGLKTSPWVLKNFWQDDKILARSPISLIWFEFFFFFGTSRRSGKANHADYQELFYPCKQKVLEVLVESGLFPCVFKHWRWGPMEERPVCRQTLSLVVLNICRCLLYVFMCWIHKKNSALWQLPLRPHSSFAWEMKWDLSTYLILKTRWRTTFWEKETVFFKCDLWAALKSL